MSAPLETLPALRGLSRLADLRPVIVTDTREQTPLTFTRLASVRDTLQSGDYSVRGLENEFAIERKSLSDLASCCSGENRQRFFRELHRLRGFRFKRLLVIGEAWEIPAKRYGSSISPKAVLSTLAVIEARFDVPVVHVKNAVEGAEAVERWVWWYAREAVERCNELLRGTEGEEPSSPAPAPESLTTASGGGAAVPQFINQHP